MHALLKLDGFVFSYVEKFSHLIQICTGFNNFWQCRLTLVCMVIINAIKCTRGYTHVGILILETIACAFWVHSTFKWEITFSRLFKRNTERNRPIIQTGFGTLRICFMLFYIFHSIMILVGICLSSKVDMETVLNHLVWTTLILLLFLISCTPLQPTPDDQDTTDLTLE